MAEQEIVVDEHLLACDGCGRVWDDVKPNDCNCICKTGDENYEEWRDATKAEAFLYHGWWRAVEQANDLEGFDLTRSLETRMDHLRQALRKAQYPDAWENLVAAVHRSRLRRVRAIRQLR